MEQWTEIRRRVLVEGVSRRQVLRETGLHWKTLQKILGHSAPPGYRQHGPRPKKKLRPHLEWIGQIFNEDKALPRKQRHTAKRISIFLEPLRWLCVGVLKAEARGVLFHPDMVQSLVSKKSKHSPDSDVRAKLKQALEQLEEARRMTQEAKRMSKVARQMIEQCNKLLRPSLLEPLVK